MSRGRGSTCDRRLGERKMGLIEKDISRGIHTANGMMKANVAFVLGTKTQEHTRKRAEV